MAWRPHPAWVRIEPTTSRKKASCETLIIEFIGRLDRKNAHPLHKFSSMGIGHSDFLDLRFNLNCVAISTIVSYSTQSYINEFQLCANLIQGKPVHLALLVHAIHGASQEFFNPDGSWHWICVSWNQNGQRWTLLADGHVLIGPDGLFIIGQEQDTFGGSFDKDESFSGSITKIHIWDRVLNRSEMNSVEKECIPNTSGLIFK
ncbi:adhesion G protein-coupled receptor D2-like [Vanacampus margaritifer]